MGWDADEEMQCNALTDCIYRQKNGGKTSWKVEGRYYLCSCKGKGGDQCFVPVGREWEVGQSCGPNILMKKKKSKKNELWTNR